MRQMFNCMPEAFVHLQCPECTKDWEENPADLPDLNKNFSCPDCHATRQLKEFMRSERDLEAVRQFQ